MTTEIFPASSKGLAGSVRDSTRIGSARRPNWVAAPIQTVTCINDDPLRFITLPLLFIASGVTVLLSGLSFRSFLIFFQYRDMWKFHYNFADHSSRRPNWLALNLKVYNKQNSKLWREKHWYRFNTQSYLITEIVLN